MKKEQLRLYASLFVGRRDDYALQQETGRYRRTGRPLTYKTLARHLLGVSLGQGQNIDAELKAVF